MCAICLTLHYFIVTFAAKYPTRLGWLCRFGVTRDTQQLVMLRNVTRYRYATVVKLRLFDWLFAVCSVIAKTECTYHRLDKTDR
jgi:hypothetical protein